MKNILKISLNLALLLLFSLSNAQVKKSITLEDIWAKGTFSQKSVSGVKWMKDGKYYTSQKGKKIIKYDITTGSETATLLETESEFDSYELSENEDKVLLQSETDPIYRYSYTAKFEVVDLKSKQKQALAGGAKIAYATFSPDGSKVAFVKENNVFMTELASMKETQVTSDGKWNYIINGASDWVYEEEFTLIKAFAWSPDNRRIAYYKFDESRVKQYNMQRWEGQKKGYPKDYLYKYPKAGEDNSLVNIYVYDLAGGKTTAIETGAEQDQYLPRMQWTKNTEMLSIRRMNRLQNKLEILHADVKTGQSRVILEEESQTYVDLDYTDDLMYLQDGKSFIHSSEKDGFKHLYLYDLNGKLIRQVTGGQWEVSSLSGVDEKNKLVYYVSTEDSPLERHLYVIGMDGKNKKKLSSAQGTHNPNFSSDFSYYLDYHSSSALPVEVTLYQAPSAKKIKVLENNQALKEKLAAYQIQYKEFMKVKAADGSELNAWMIKPANFDAAKKYPLLMFVYGGPGSQTVQNSWEGSNFYWYQTLAEKGYLVVSVDNRGTGGRGKNFKHATYKQLGKYEIQDQMAAANYLGTLPYVDASRIGIWGWSYGGYMASLGITVGAEVFKTAIAVAPVSTWRFYDTIYTERFLQRPQDNASGYDDNSPINHVDKMKGKFLLVHGTGDDNVHFQNAVELQNALIKAGKQFQSFYYPNRNHGIFGGNTRLHLYQMMTDFLVREL